MTILFQDYLFKNHYSDIFQIIISGDLVPFYWPEAELSGIKNNSFNV